MLESYGVQTGIYDSGFISIPITMHGIRERIGLLNILRMIRSLEMTLSITKHI